MCSYSFNVGANLFPLVSLLTGARYHVGTSVDILFGIATFPSSGPVSEFSGEYEGSAKPNHVHIDPKQFSKLKSLSESTNRYNISQTQITSKLRIPI